MSGLRIVAINSSTCDSSKQSTEERNLFLKKETGKTASRVAAKSIETKMYA